MKRFAIFGSSGFGREVLPLMRQQLQQTEGQPWDLVFVDDNPAAAQLNGHRVLTYEQWLAEPAASRHISLAIGSSTVREKLVTRCANDGVAFFEVRAANVVVMDEVQIGPGAVLSPFVTLTSNIRIGQQFHANLYSYVAHDCVIGDFVTFARAKRDALRLAMLNGDPLKPVKKKESLTLKQASEKYWEGRKDISPSYRMNAENAIKQHIEPKLGDRNIGELTRTEVLEVLMVMDASGLYDYVRKTRMWLGQVFDCAVEQEHATINPCALIDPRKAFSKATVESFASLDVTDIHEFMDRLKLEGIIQSAQACRLLALTWVRTQELRMMEWTEIDGDLWRIPAGKMKRRRDHLVPLSKQALVILENMRQRSTGSVYVFPNDRRADRPMSENAVLYLIGRMGYGGKMTGHGWRSVASTWANEAGFDKDAIERQLAHAPDDKVRATYNRAEYLPERKTMLQAWSDWLTKEGQPSPGTTDASSASSA